MAGGVWYSLGRVRFRTGWKGELTLAPLIFELSLREPSGATYQMNPVGAQGDVMIVPLWHPSQES